jgi:hypothetical protein
LIDSAADGAGLNAAVASSTTLGNFLSAAAAARETILLIVNDPYRATQTRPALVTLTAKVRAMASPPRFKALVATGTHLIDRARRWEFETPTFADCGLAIDSVNWHESKDTAAMVAIGGVE